jgi:hypothetical protein
MLTLDVQSVPTAEQLLLLRRAGVDAETLKTKETERPFNFADVVAPMPLGFTQLIEGQVLTLAGRRWQVHLGSGHAPDHATLWSLEDDLILGGDQLLPGISANIGVYATEPEADPLADWLAACRPTTPGFGGPADPAHQGFSSGGFAKSFLSPLACGQPARVMGASPQSAA